MVASISNEITIEEIVETIALFLYIAVYLGNNARTALTCMILLLWFNCMSLRTIQLGIMRLGAS